MVATITGDGERLKAGDLTEALTAGKPIMVVHLADVPVRVAGDPGEQAASKGKRFAVIADEAHSTQTGAAASKLKQVLTADETADLDDGGEVDVEAILAAEMAAATARTRNISFFAFTATPKSKTMELFGTAGPSKPAGGHLPGAFHTYSMQQAIEEGFILDVLANYTTYDMAFRLATHAAAKDASTTPGGGRVEATKGLMRWVQLHPTTSPRRCRSSSSTSDSNVTHLLGGTAKAMVVTVAARPRCATSTPSTPTSPSTGYPIGLLGGVLGRGGIDPETGSAARSPRQT